MRRVEVFGRTADQFEASYAEASGVTVEWLREHGRVVRPCDCEYDDCRGWQSVALTEYEEVRSRWNDRHVILGGRS